MPAPTTTWRRLGFWVGPLLLIGSLLLGLVVVLVVFPLAMFLLPVPAGGLLLGVWLIVRGPEPRWAKLLALSPVLGPLLLLGLMEVATWLPPPQNHLVFLLPVGFRGQVTLSQNMLQMGPAPLVNGQLLLEIPRYGGHLDIREPLASSDLCTAEYYVAAASGERLYRLPLLTEGAGGPAGQLGSPPTNPRQVGIFAVGPPPTPAATGLRALAATWHRLTTNPYDKVEGLTFIVARADSLAIQRQWYK